MGGAPLKSAFVAIVGRPSSGKSTLMNALCGHKVSIVSAIPQTTRNQVKGIVNRADVGQLVFLDTPGFHLSDKKFNLKMMENVDRSLKDADVVVYLVDATKETGTEEAALREHLKTVRAPLILALNKTETKAHKAGALEAEIRQALDVRSSFAISGLAQRGLEDLVAGIFALAPEGEPYYPEEYYTDQDPSFRISEIIREQAIVRLNEEIPHAVYVEIADLEFKDPERNQGVPFDRDDKNAAKPTLWIRAFLTVDRTSQVGIVVGKDGAKIKEIRVASQKELGKIFAQRIHLDLRVKVNEKWRTKDHLIRGILGSTNGLEE